MRNLVLVICVNKKDYTKYFYMKYLVIVRINVLNLPIKIL